MAVKCACYSNWFITHSVSCAMILVVGWFQIEWIGRIGE